MDDKTLRQDILEELDFEPSLHSTDLGVVVEGRVVTLRGHVPSLAAQTTLIEIVESVRGVRAIADEIEVRPVGAHITADDEIAKRVVNTLKWNACVPAEMIHVTVGRGWVTLRGDVEWQYQSHAAEHAIRRLLGVIGVNNQIKVVSSASVEDVSDRIRDALQRNAEIEAKDIHITVHGGVVTLEGKVRQLAERRNVERAAWSVPGVVAVVDRIAVM